MLTRETSNNAPSRESLDSLVTALQPTIETWVRTEAQKRHMNDVTYQGTLEDIRKEYISDSLIAEKASQWPAKTVTNISRLLSTSKEGSSAGSIVLIALTAGEEARIVNGMILLESFNSLYSEYSEEEDSYLLLRQTVGGLTRYEHLGFTLPENVLSGDLKGSLVATALSAVRLGLIYLGEKGLETDPHTEDTYLADDKLAQLVIDHPLSASQILELMEERDLFNAEALRSIIESESQPLSTGIL